MNLLLLAPDIHEAILFLLKTFAGHDPIKLKHLQPVCREMDWGNSGRGGVLCRLAFEGSQYLLF
jgi:hypothetical protein